MRRLALSACALLAAGLAGCKPMSPQEQAQPDDPRVRRPRPTHISDPHWTGWQVTGAYPTDDGVDVVLTAQGVKVTASCGVVSGYYTHVISDVYKIEGVEPQPGQLYLPAQHRWLTDDELHARLADLLAPRPGEYAGARWAPNPPGVYTVSDLAGVPSTNCFTLQSTLEPARQLVACQVAAGHRYWVSQGGVSEGPLTFELGATPAGLPAIPPAPKPDLATQPGGVPH